MPLDFMWLGQRKRDLPLLDYKPVVLYLIIATGFLWDVITEKLCLFDYVGPCFVFCLRAFCALLFSNSLKQQGSIPAGCLLP